LFVSRDVLPWRYSLFELSEHATGELISQGSRDESGHPLTANNLGATGPNARSEWQILSGTKVLLSNVQNRRDECPMNV
jgi:hypothetical protein